MTKAVEILTELRCRGVSIAVDGETLCLTPKGALNNGLLARIREAKPAILEVLRTRLTCWHCGGSRQCNCFTCGVMKPSVVWTAGECVACKTLKARVQ